MNAFLRKSGVIGLILVISMTACQNRNSANNDNDKVNSDRNTGLNEGVTLLIANAALIEVDSNPQYNTAEWHFTVMKPGRYDVWLSSLTCDTAHLQFADTVIITAGDTRLTKMPVGDQIVMDDKSVTEPWYRADSHMGSIFFSKPGEYQVQVISDRVEPHSSDVSRLNVDKHTLINSVILKPKVN